MIKPTVSRILHFYRPGLSKPLAAFVTDVRDEYTVSLAIFNPNGSQYTGHSEDIPLIQEGQDKPLDSPYAVWPPLAQPEVSKVSEVQKASTLTAGKKP